MTRPCRITGCRRDAAKRRLVCHRHHYRLTHYGDPDYSTWTTADQTEVELLVRDPRPAHGLTRLEQRLIAQGLTAKDVPAHEIARILHVTPRTIHRWRATHRAA